MMLELFHHLLSSPVLAGPAPAPDPGFGTAPPGSDGILMILKWVAYLVSVCCVGGILFVAGQMALQHQRGEAGQHAGRLGMVLVACIVAGSASAIVGTFI